MIVNAKFLKFILEHVDLDMAFAELSNRDFTRAEGQWIELKSLCDDAGEDGRIACKAVRK